ncbi:MAG: hypothetical protein ACI9XC_000637 [Gammaproteobacteria bacterium]|jgi:hypothetical protein
MKIFNKLIFTPLLLMTLQIFSTALYAQSSVEDVDVASQAGVEHSDIVVRSWVDRTALFPGDRLTYYVEILCSNNVDILMDDLSEDELVLSGLELITSNIKQTTNPSGTQYLASYSLITYEIDTAELKIDELRLRYYYKRPGQRIEDVATVGEVVVPSTLLVLRSTLPAELSSLALRDMLPAQLITSWLGMVGMVGLLLIILTGIPAGIYIANRRREQKPDTQHQLDEIVKVTSTELEKIKKYDLQDKQQRRECFDQLEKVLKEYIEKTTGVLAIALTANELAAYLLNNDINLKVDELVLVLQDCEQARYGKHENMPEAHRIEVGISYAESLLT